MLRRMLALVGATLILIAIAVPVSADPPPESGAVVRFEGDGFGVFPDFVNGYWVFSNVTRADFCQWFYDMEFEPFPSNQSPEDVQLVFVNDALLISVRVEAPTALHAFVGEDPFINPCDGSAVDTSFEGVLNVRINDNDGPNEGKRANSFGDRAQGILYDDGGNRYHYSWTFRAIWPPDENFPGADPVSLKVVTNKFNLHPIG